MRTFQYILFLFLPVILIGQSTLIQIPLESREQLHQLRQQYDVTAVDRLNGTVDLIVEDADKAALQKHSRATVLIGDLEAHLASLRNEDYFENFTSYPKMLAALESAVATYPHLAELHDIGDSYLKTQGRGGYDIWALKISDDVAVNDTTEADVMIMGNIHAREIITPEIVMHFIDYLLQGYGSDPYVTHLVNNREIWLLPMTNPDGHEYVFTGDVNNVFQDALDPARWRKNMRDNNGNALFDPTEDGVDLNRNFGFAWGIDDEGSSPVPSDATYRGPDAFSEPEAQVLRDFARAHDFRISLCYHSYGSLLIYPWGFTTDPVPEPDFSSFLALADSMTAYNGYISGNSESLLYSVNGDTDDWFYGELGIFAFTPEVGSRQQGFFWPPVGRIESQIQENLGMNLYAVYAAGEEPIVEKPFVSLPAGNIRIEMSIHPPIPLTTPVNLDKSSFRVFYRFESDAEFQSESLHFEADVPIFAAVIQRPAAGGMMEFYVEAADSIGRTGRYPRGAPMAVDSVFIESTTDVAGMQPVADFELAPNIPNPFNASTRLEYTLAGAADIQLNIYNVLGEKVHTLFSGLQTAGRHSHIWDGKNNDGALLAGGIYIARLVSPTRQSHQKLILLR